MNGKLRALFVTSECAPWSKTGGLADVSASLPAALRNLGVDIRVLVPAYSDQLPASRHDFARLEKTARFPGARVIEAALPSGVPALLLDCPPYYVRDGGPYQNSSGHDWGDNAPRFAQLARAAAAIANGLSSSWRPDIVHCNDWQTALAPVYLHYSGSKSAATVVTIHNLAFQGLFPAQVVEAVELPPASFAVEGLEFYGQCSFLKGGLVYADALTTVSPTYASEIQRAPLGMGLEGVLHGRRAVLTGILNGIDTAVWNPRDDPYLPRHYDDSTLELKLVNKRQLQLRARLPAADLPMFAMVSRLTEQKGVDWVIEIAPLLAALPLQLIVLGRGESKYERDLSALASAHSQKISVQLAFDESWAHLIEAGADALLMPSRFEPCGMNQMYSQRYGTVPIVRATGGLADSVDDYSSPDGTGFVFTEPNATALHAAIRRALDVYHDADAWRRLQLNGMSRDFSWRWSAGRYVEIYERIARSQGSGGSGQSL